MAARVLPSTRCKVCKARLALATTMSNIFSKAAGNTYFSRGKLTTTDNAVLAMKEKNYFLLNKTASQCPRPIAIKVHLLFCFVFHICFQSGWLSFPNLMGTLSRGSPVPWELALCLKGSTMPLHATHYRAQPKGPCQPAARSQTHSSSSGRKQVREWILSVSYNSNGI